MMAPRVVVNCVFEGFPVPWLLLLVAKISLFAMSRRLSSISVSLLAATYESVIVPDSTLVDVAPPDGLNGTTAPWLSPKYSPRRAIANGSATTNLTPRLTPYQESDGVPEPNDSLSKSPLSAKLTADDGL